jgi:hypothetical protein
MGTLLPEDIRLLAQNHKVFPHLKFDAHKDVPPGYQMNSMTIMVVGVVLPGVRPYVGPWNGIY